MLVGQRSTWKRCTYVGLHDLDGRFEEGNVAGGEVDRIAIAGASSFPFTNANWSRAHLALG